MDLVEPRGTFMGCCEYFSFLFSAVGRLKPLNDELPLGKGRMALGIFVFVLGLLSLTNGAFPDGLK